MQRKNYLAIFLFLLALSVVLLGLWKLNFLGVPSSIVSGIFSPGREVVLAQVQGKTDWNQFVDLSKNAEHQRLTAENSALRDQFEESYPAPINLVPAKIIGFPGVVPSVNPPSFIILNKGSGDGVKKGHAVVFLNNLIGKITDVNSNSSKAILVTNTGFSSTGKLESGNPGVARGAVDSLELNNILLSEEVKKNSLVLSKGEEGQDGTGIPPDLVIGKVASVEKKSSDLFQRVKVQTLVDISKLTTVFVIVK